MSVLAEDDFEFSITDPDGNPIPDEFGPIAGGFADLQQKELFELHPTLTYLFVKLREKYPDFDLNIIKIFTGKYQIAGAWHYLLNVQTIDKKSEIKLCEADVTEIPWENYVKIKLTCQGKNYSIETKLPNSKPNDRLG